MKNTYWTVVVLKSAKNNLVKVMDNFSKAKQFKKEMLKKYKKDNVFFDGHTCKEEALDFAAISR